MVACQKELTDNTPLRSIHRSGDKQKQKLSWGAFLTSESDVAQCNYSQRPSPREQMKPLTPTAYIIINGNAFCSNSLVW